MRNVRVATSLDDPMTTVRNRDGSAKRTSARVACKEEKIACSEPVPNIQVYLRTKLETKADRDSTRGATCVNEQPSQRVVFTSVLRQLDSHSRQMSANSRQLHGY